MSRTLAALAVSAVALALVPITQASGEAAPRAGEPIVVEAGGARVVVERSPPLG